MSSTGARSRAARLRKTTECCIKQWWRAIISLLLIEERNMTTVTAQNCSYVCDTMLSINILPPPHCNPFCQHPSPPNRCYYAKFDTCVSGKTILFKLCGSRRCTFFEFYWNNWLNNWFFWRHERSVRARLFTELTIFGRELFLITSACDNDEVYVLGVAALRRRRFLCVHTCMQFFLFLSLAADWQLVLFWFAFLSTVKYDRDVTLRVIFDLVCVFCVCVFSLCTVLSYTLGQTSENRSAPKFCRQNLAFFSPAILQLSLTLLIPTSSSHTPPPLYTHTLTTAAVIRNPTRDQFSHIPSCSSHPCLFSLTLLTAPRALGDSGLSGHRSGGGGGSGSTP